MSATKARRRRRAHLHILYLQKRVIEETVDAMLDIFNQSPNQALLLCFEWFGRDHFQNVLRRFIFTNRLKPALILAVKYCIENKPKTMAAAGGAN
jgi:hypothetical protein